MKLIHYDQIIKVNDRNGKMIVTEPPRRVYYGKFKRMDWRVKIKCDCGKQQDAYCVYWYRKKYKMCRNCELIGSNNYSWTGYGDISGEVFYIMKKNAHVRGLEYSLSKKYLWDLFLNQNKKCALTGMELRFSKTNTNRSEEATASLDRIDSSKGYVEGNVQWIHKDVNKMKNNYDQNYYIEMCKKVFEYSANNSNPASLE